MADHFEILVSAISSALAVDEASIPSDITFLDLGGDSLAALYVAEELESQGLEINPMDLIEGQTLQQAALGIRKII